MGKNAGSRMELLGISLMLLMVVIVAVVGLKASGRSTDDLVQLATDFVQGGTPTPESPTPSNNPDIVDDAAPDGLVFNMPVLGLPTLIPSIDLATPEPLLSAPRPGHEPAPTPISPQSYARVIPSTQIPMPEALPDYEDSFDDPSSGWRDNDRRLGYELSYDDGEYNLFVKDENTLVWVAQKDDFLDPDVQLHARHEGGEEDVAYGLLFGMLDSNNYYAFMVNPVSQEYYVSARIVGTEVPIADWTKASQINQGHSSNTLRVAIRGTKVQVNVNGHMLASIEDDNLVFGRIGLAAQNLSSPVGANVYMDNLRVNGKTWASVQAGLENRGEARNESTDDCVEPSTNPWASLGQAMSGVLVCGQSSVDTMYATIPVSYPGCTDLQNIAIEAARRKAMSFVHSAITELDKKTVTSTTTTALHRHFIDPNANERAEISFYYVNMLKPTEGTGANQRLGPLTPEIFRCATLRECLDTDADPAALPEIYRGSREYPHPDTPTPSDQTTDHRIVNADAYGFFAHHVRQGNDIAIPDKRWRTSETQAWWDGSMINICPRFTRFGTNAQAIILIHEAAHAVDIDYRPFLQLQLVPQPGGPTTLEGLPPIGLE